MIQRVLVLLLALTVAGSLVAVEGGRTAAAPAAQPTPKAETRAVEDAIGPENWAVLLCQFADSPATPPHTAYAYRMGFQNKAKSVRNFFTQSSYGQLDLTFSVKNWKRLDRDRSDFGTFNQDGESFLFDIYDACTAAHTGSVNFNNFDGVLIIFDDRDVDAQGNVCFGSGCIEHGIGINYGYQSIPRMVDGKTGHRAVWLAYAGGVPGEVAAHEMLHTYGVGHSAAGADDAGAYGECFPEGPPVCGHPWDPMASAWLILPPDSDTLAANKVFQLDWINGARRCNVTSDVSEVTFELERLTRPRANNRCLAITISHPLAPEAWYVVEARFRLGFDADNSPDFGGGGIPGPAVLISRMCSGGTFCTFEPMVVGRDINGDFSIDEESAEWQAGEVFTSVGGYIQIQVVSQGAGFYTVKVTRDSSP